MRFVYNRSSICFLLGLVACTSAFSQFAHAQDAPTTDRFVIGPDSKPQDGVPNGKLTAATITSKVYPDVSFKYQVYVPAQYDGSKPGAVMVFQDGNNYVREPGLGTCRWCSTI